MSLGYPQVQAGLAAPAAPTAFASGRYWSPEWALSYGVLTALLTVIFSHGLSLYVLLGLLGLYLVLYWRGSARALLPAAPLLALPLLAVVSALWSDAPGESFRHGLQFGLTVFAALLIARRTPGPALIGATFFALLTAGLLSLLFGTWTEMGYPPVMAFVGIFGGKNEMAVIASLLALSAAAAAVDPRQPGAVRLAGAAGVLFAALLLHNSRSTGALISTLAAGALFVALTVISRLRLKWRALAAAVLLMAATPAVFAGDEVARVADSVLVDKLGKDRTLTGRTYLWERAQDYIARRPVLGHGYQAFWRQGSLEAEGLWRFAGIRTRTGFNFHNQYIEVLVEMGWVGLITLAATLSAVLAAFAARLVARPTPTVVFAASGFLLLLVRTPTESITLVQFSVATFFLFLTSAVGLTGERPLR